MQNHTCFRNPSRLRAFPLAAGNILDVLVRPASFRLEEPKGFKKMPRTSAVECPGCPPLRALTTDVLGLVKVVEARGKTGIPKMVETWGQPDASSCVLAASYSDRKTDPDWIAICVCGMQRQDNFYLRFSSSNI
ncbi:unnamed protein product [Musa textilis]